MIKRLALWVADRLRAFAGQKKSPPAKSALETVKVFGCSVTIDRAHDKVTILHKPGDSFETAMERHQNIIAYLHREDYL
jgi:hypothetical protein